MGSLVVAVYPIAGALLPIRFIHGNKDALPHRRCRVTERVSCSLRACTVWRLPRDDRIHRRGDKMDVGAHWTPEGVKFVFRSAELSAVKLG